MFTLNAFGQRITSLPRLRYADAPADPTPTITPPTEPPVDPTPPTEPAPAEPTPPAEPPKPAAPKPPVKPKAGEEPPSPPAGETPEQKIARLEREVAQARKEAAGRRTDERDAMQKAYAKLGKDLGLVEDNETLTAEQLAERLGTELGTTKAELAQARTDLTAAKQRDAIKDSAATHHGDVTLLGPFLRESKEFQALDLADDDYASQVDALVKVAIENNPKLKASQVPPSSGGGNAPSGEPPVIDKANMSVDQIREARRKERASRGV